MNDVRLVLKAISQVGVDRFYEHFDRVIVSTEEISDDHDAEYGRLAVETAKQIVEYMTIFESLRPKQ